MRDSSNIDPQELRCRIGQKLGTLSVDELAMVNGLLSQLEAHRLLGEIGAAVDDARTSGQWANIDQTIRDFRSRHPYR